MHSNLEVVGGVDYDATEKTYAEKIYATLDGPDDAIGSEADVQPIKYDIGMGSTDVGDLSWTVPTVNLETATWVPGTSAHSWQAIAAGGTTIGIKGLQVAAKTMALTAEDLFQNPAEIEAAWEELRERQGEDYVYSPLLGDRDPPLDYRK